MRICRRLLCTAFAVATWFAAPLAWAAACDSLGPCAARACRLDAQIARAKDKGLAREVVALERQRADMVHCSDDGIRQKRKAALEQAQARVDRREAELKKAEATGDAARVKKAQRNLQGARKTYAEIENSPL
ncbi:MAG TPA: DUF1090 family protein [Casimicrobiaceae bacterium]|nr:DUF1090 family protein [Casimicrobiaceae bacterium]